MIIYIDYFTISFNLKGLIYMIITKISENSDLSSDQ